MARMRTRPAALRSWPEPRSASRLNAPLDRTGERCVLHAAAHTDARKERLGGGGEDGGGSKYARVASPPARPPSSFHLSLLLGWGTLERTRLKRNNDARASAKSSSAERNLDFE